MNRRIHPLAGAAVLGLALAALPSPAAAQPTELFFSEYIEGSSNNKALEIFNGTSGAVSLPAGAYNVQMYFNGSTTAGLTINLTGTVAAGDVYVVAHSSADAAILGVADQTNGAGWFNGDDAVVLRRGTTILDVIGQIGFDPGTEWGAGLTSTADNTLRRNMAIVAGDPNGSNAFDPVFEWIGFATNTFGGLGCHTADTSCPVPPPPPATPATIAEIQGPGLASPLAGQRRRTEGNVVTAVFSDGFFIQTVGEGDGAPASSEGVFVFTGDDPPTVAVGNEVTVTGKVVEFFEMTELDAEEVVVTGSGLPLPAPVAFDAATPSPNQPQPANEMERFEGMLVRVADGVVSSPSNQFAEASIVAASRRAFREPGIAFPGLPGLPVWDGNPEIFEIDTDRFGPPPALRVAAGAVVTVEGPLAFSFSDYQIWPTSLVVQGEPAVRPVRARAAGEFTVGTQNVLRLFDLVDDPDTDDPVPTPAQYALRLAKLSRLVLEALRAPEILAIQEVENLTALQDLAAAIRAADPMVVYSARLMEGNDIGGIDVGFLVRSTVRVDSIEQFGKDETFEFNGATALLNDRPPLVLRGAYVGNGAPFPIVVVSVHQRSLSGVDGNDGARIRAKRHRQAERLSQFIDELQQAEPGLRLTVIGDFNAFEFTDGYVDVMGQVTGRPDPAGALLPATDEIAVDLTNQTLEMPEGERYSFVFDGTAQSLDHAITSRTLGPWLRGAEHARGNADAPFLFDTDPTTALRSSDHDGTVVFVMSDFDADGIPDDADACAATTLPESVPTVRLLVNHYALTDGDDVFDTIAPPGGGGTPPTYTLQSTRGCSCGEIIERLGLGEGQRKFGCTRETMEIWAAGQP
jgi:predicted extracellular nuclease